MMEFFCAVEIVPDFGIVPLMTEARICTFAAFICAYVVNGPGPLDDVASWHDETAHDDEMIGATFAEN